MATARTVAARRVEVTGVVQGVGFRPFVHRLAVRHGLAGWVRNTAGEVQIHIEGDETALDNFVRALASDAPPLARIDTLVSAGDASTGADGFAIVESVARPDTRQPICPDVATCDTCLAELFDPGNRRFHYPFITCTDCGPRFTVIESMPYDRERTSMRAFPMCRACSAEYALPGDRRFHSETNSCALCGPRLWFEGGDRAKVMDATAALQLAAGLLERGGILALRGLGGFHLAVDATNPAAVQRLRERKHRDAKPLAVMVSDLAGARALARVTDAEARLLQSAERPIVLLEELLLAEGAAEVAPGLDRIGVMLPYTPIHHLLLAAVRRPLVMTSGNASEEPIAIGNDEARRRLANIADGWLLHDREIVARYDDSVVRVVAGAPVFLRRSRGYAPLPLALPVASPVPLLAVGAHLKNTFTLAHGATAYVSQHIGDLENVETLEHFRASLARFGELFRVEPARVVRDLHPGYLSTRLADELTPRLGEVIAVQHHHAHVAAVMAEHGVTTPVLGVAYDGTGYGDDGAVWGAELLLADLTGYRRMAHLRNAPLPGGDAAARAPWRVACGYLSLDTGLEDAFRLAIEGVDDLRRAAVSRQIARGLNAPRASSMGRLFDAAAAVIGLRHTCAYESQAAMELEALAGTRHAEALPFEILRDDRGSATLGVLPLLAALGERRQAGDSLEDLAAAFHETVAVATHALVDWAREETGVLTVALGGGCFQNARLLSRVRELLVDDGFTVLVPQRLSPNDGAISYGQAAVAAARLAFSST